MGMFYGEGLWQYCTTMGLTIFFITWSQVWKVGMPFQRSPQLWDDHLGSGHCLPGCSTCIKLLADKQCYVSGSRTHRAKQSRGEVELTPFIITLGSLPCRNYVPHFCDWFWSFRGCLPLLNMESPPFWALHASGPSGKEGSSDTWVLEGLLMLWGLVMAAIRHHSQHHLMMAKPKAHTLRTSSQTTLAAGLLGKEVNINSGLGATTAGELHLLTLFYWLSCWKLFL